MINFTCCLVRKVIYLPLANFNSLPLMVTILLLF